MYNPSTNWIEQIKYIVREMVNTKTFVLEGVVTSVDPSPPHCVRVMLEPYGIESGWLRCATPYAGNGFGLLLPPPDEGTPVKVIFDLGDIKNGTVIGSLYNDQVKRPNVGDSLKTAQQNPGMIAAGLVHKSGSSLLILQDGTIKLSTKSSDAITISPSGGVTIKGAVTISGRNYTQSW